MLWLGTGSPPDSVGWGMYISCLLGPTKNTGVVMCFFCWCLVGVGQVLPKWFFVVRLSSHQSFGCRDRVFLELLYCASLCQAEGSCLYVSLPGHMGGNKEIQEFTIMLFHRPNVPRQSALVCLPFRECPTFIVLCLRVFSYKRTSGRNGTSLPFFYLNRRSGQSENKPLVKKAKMGQFTTKLKLATVLTSEENGLNNIF